jgi:hypothetical protein
MDWRKLSCLIGVGLLVMGFSLPASADDESDEVEIKVQSTLEAVNCTATPPTISVLGLTIDISKASINRNEDEDIEDGEGDVGNGDLTCADLEAAARQVVEVKLASDIPDPATGLLSATEVDIGGGECEDTVCDEVEITGPIQAVDTNVKSVTVLGLVVDISGASLQGADDEDTEGENQPVDVNQLIVGQIVELELDPTQLPNLVATTLEVKNFSNEVDVEVVDEDGNEVDEDIDDVQADVKVTTKVKAPAGAPVAPKRVKKVMKFHTTSNGRFKLTGLPTGQAKIVVTRVHNGHTTAAKRSFVVNGKRTKHLRMRLKPVL